MVFLQYVFMPQAVKDSYLVFMLKKLIQFDDSDEEDQNDEMRQKKIKSV